jgi:hypothetical protein
MTGEAVPVPIAVGDRICPLNEWLYGKHHWKGAIR